jgi:hypothetical protein
MANEGERNRRATAGVPVSAVCRVAAPGRNVRAAGPTGRDAQSVEEAEHDPGCRMIERVGGPVPARATPGRHRAAGRFEIATEQPAAAQAAPDIATVSLGPMLAMQEAEAAAVGDREARRHGEDVLRELSALQRDLLGEGASPEGLARLADLAARARAAADPRLRDVLEAIMLRARIELARHAHDAQRASPRA